MKHMKSDPLRSLFTSARARALSYEREQRHRKVLECMTLKEENDKLWELAMKQRVALEALQKGHAQDMAEMTESLRVAHARLAAAESERDRYREALRRAFPGKEVQTA